MQLNVGIYLSNRIIVVIPRMLVIGWQWHSWEEFPQPAFLPVRIAKRQGYHPFQNAKDL